MEFVTSEGAPAPGGHYSQAVVAGGMIYVSGQLPFDLGGRMPDGIDAQTRQVLDNTRAILAERGATLNDIVSATVYVSGIDLWPQVNRIWAEVFGTHRPARAIAVSPQLHHGALVEVQVIAEAPAGTDGR